MAKDILKEQEESKQNKLKALDQVIAQIEKQHGKGSIILSTLSALGGCIGHNPVLDKLIVNIVEK